jgi:hypothetical protein
VVRLKRHKLACNPGESPVMYPVSEKVSLYSER